MKRAAAACVAVTLGWFGALMLASPAQATEPDLGTNPPNVVVTSYDCEIRLVLDNSGPYTDGIGHDGPWFAEFDYRLPGDPQLPVESDLEGLKIGDPPLVGQPFDGLHNPVPVPAGETVTLDLTAEPGTVQVEVRLVRGSEQRVWFDWRSYPINCPAPSPTPTPTATATAGPSPTQPVPSPVETDPGTKPVGKEGGLPVTGSPVAIMGIIGALLMALGVAGIVASRLRRARS